MSTHVNHLTPEFAAERSTPPCLSADLQAFYEANNWYALYTCANREKQVASQLAGRGVEHYLPLYKSVRQWSDRRMRLDLPLFPGYVFVRTPLRQRVRVMTVTGVVSLVSCAGQPTPIEPEVITNLREAMTRVDAEPFPYLPVGQPVRICSGPLKGWSGVLLRHKGANRVVISIGLIQRAFIADVNSEHLVPDGPVLSSPIAVRNN
jgi:transcription antitermination factor NusG